MELAGLVLSTAWASALDLVPVIVVLLFFQLAVLRRPLPNPRRIGIGLAYVFVGMTLFLVGLQEALFPIGRTMALQLAEISAQGGGNDAALDWRDYLMVYAFAAAVGFTTAIAEPALIAVALKAQETSGGAMPALGLRLAVAIGVGFGVALGTFRIVTGLPLPYFIIAGYAIVMVQTWTSPRAIVPLAYDTGGVSTSTVTVPVVAALGLGLAATVPGRSPLIDGFGLIAFACVCPIMSVLAYVWLAHRLRRKPTSGGAKS
ncbi:MAG TPA: DUF1538 domain-containing protein [Rhodospirillales bacterium]|nr:DUF1538 domain-containing protein [Rhodospirillales bacterium]